MTLVPLILRELRCESRRPMNYWLRLAGAGVILIYMAGALQSGVSGNSGKYLFTTMQELLFYAIWLIVPLVTADCISSEMRNGTLGILFLTSLKPVEITLAKAVAQMIRSLSILIAVIPCLLIPLLAGGVTNYRAAAVAIIFLCGTVLFMCCGLLASACSKSWGMAVFIAYLLAIPAAIFLGIFISVSEKSVFGVYSAVIFSAMGSFVAVNLAQAAVGSSWKYQPPTPDEERIRTKYYQPRFLTGVFKYIRHRQLRHNPVTWLFIHTAHARMTIWLAMLLVVIWICIFPPLYLLTLLQLWMCILVAHRFQNTLHDGTLQVLLTTPVSLKQVLWGYSVGGWIALGLPSGLVFLLRFLPFSANTGFPFGSTINFIGMISFWVCFLLLPLATMALSLYIRNPIAAGLVSVMLTSYFPTLFYHLMSALGMTGMFSILGYLISSLFPLVGMVVITMLAIRVLRSRLKEHCVSSA